MEKETFEKYLDIKKECNSLRKEILKTVLDVARIKIEFGLGIEFFKIIDIDDCDFYYFVKYESNQLEQIYGNIMISNVELFLPLEEIKKLYINIRNELLKLKENILKENKDKEEDFINNIIYGDNEK